jgi:hypothetical protein
MKKIVALALAASFLPSVLLADGNHPMAGCGLAYALFSSRDNSKPIQVLASTTNNLWGTQSFGITSGTSGCTEDGAVKFVAEAEVFAEVNLKEISREMAAGGGEYLNSFASLLGVRADKRTEFFRMTQEKYTALLPSAETGSVELLNNLSRELSARPELLS